MIYEWYNLLLMSCKYVFWILYILYSLFLIFLRAFNRKFIHLFSWKTNNHCIKTTKERCKNLWQLFYKPGPSSLGVPGVPWHTQYVADQLTLFQPGGTDYAHLITTGIPRFSDLPTALLTEGFQLQSRNLDIRSTWYTRRPLMTSNFRVGRGFKNDSKNRTF